MIAIIIIISFSFNPYFWKIELFWPLHLFIEESNVCLFGTGFFDWRENELGCFWDFYRREHFGQTVFYCQYWHIEYFLMKILKRPPVLRDERERDSESVNEILSALAIACAWHVRESERELHGELLVGVRTVDQWLLSVEVVHCRCQAHSCSSGWSVRTCFSAIGILCPTRVMCKITWS